MQGAAWVFEHFLLPFMHEHISKFDPSFKNAGNVLDNVRALLQATMGRNDSMRVCSNKPAAVPCCLSFPLCRAMVHPLWRMAQHAPKACVSTLVACGWRGDLLSRASWAQARAEASRVSHQHGPPGFPAPKVTEGYAD